MVNETGKHFISLDRKDYTCYSDEVEILIQAGLRFKVKSYEVQKITGGEITVFSLEISE